METRLSKRAESNRYRRGDKLAAGETARVPVRGAPSKSARRSCSCILWNASRYFLAPKEHTVQPKSGLLRKVLKFGHAFSGRRGGGRSGTSRKRARAKERSWGWMEKSAVGKKGKKQKQRESERGGIKSSVTALDESPYRLLERV